MKTKAHYLKWPAGTAGRNVILLFIMMMMFPAFVQAQYPAGSPVAINGHLKVQGPNLVNSCGNAVQLRGMASHGIQWFGNCITASSIQALAKDWGADILRVTMYIREGGYETNPAYFRQRIDEIVDECGKQGIYCVIDFHVHRPGDPNTYITEAREFWGYMSVKHAGKNHVLYEICNEPNGVYWEDVKTYANEIIPLIRTNDPNSIIIVGDPSWSQAVDVASKDPLAYPNLLYALHFYSGNHKQDLRNRANEAIANGIALMVTEWGTTDVGSVQQPLIEESEKWVQWMNRRNISWMNWSFSDKAETSAALTPGSCGGSWNSTTTSGTWVKNHIQNPSNDFVCNGSLPLPNIQGPYFSSPVKVPGVIEAENFDKGDNMIAYNDVTTLNDYGYKYRNDDVDLDTAIDGTGSYAVSGVTAGEWLEYTVDVQSGGTYTVNLRIATALDARSIHFYVDGRKVTRSVFLPNTGGLQNWASFTIPCSIDLTQGTHIIRVYMETDQLSLNYFTLNRLSNTDVLPVNCAAHFVPGKIEFEDYLSGDNNVTYFDNTPGNQFSKYRSDDVDIQSCDDTLGGYNLGYIAANEWLNYSIYVTKGGYYDFQTRAACIFDGKKIHYSVDGLNVTGKITLANTGGWQVWQTVVTKGIYLSAGYHTLQLYTEADGFNLNYLEVVEAKEAYNQAPSIVVTAPANGASLSFDQAIDITATAIDMDGSIAVVEFFVGATKIGQVENPPYKISWTATQLGSYTITATATDDKGVVTTSAPVVITITTPGNCASQLVPGKIEFEDYMPGANSVAYYDNTPGNQFSQYRKDDVDIEKTKDEGGGYHIGYIAKNEWLRYAIYVKKSGYYDFNTRVGSIFSNRLIHYKIDNVNKTGSISLPNTGGWQTWVTVSKKEIYLSEGCHTLELYMESDNFNLNYLEVVETANPSNKLPSVSLISPVQGSVYLTTDTIDVSANAVDEDGIITSVRFYAGSTLIGEALSAPYKLKWNAAAGKYSIKAIATDNKGASTTSQAAVITVNEPNKAPTVSITAPANGSSYYAPAAFTLQASATDTDGTIQQVSLFEGTVLRGTDNAAPFTFDFSGVAVGTYTYSVVATDDDGATSPAASITVTVTQKPNVLPQVSITSPATGSSMPLPVSATIAANASDADGTVALVEFFAGANKIGEDASSPYSIVWSPTVEGSYSLTAVVTDNEGAKTTSSSILVTITPKPDCNITAVPAASNFGVANNWSDQSAGSKVSNTTSALQIDHRQWGNNYLWVFETNRTVSLQKGVTYTFKFDFKNDASNPVTGIEFGLATGSQWSGPNLAQTAVAVTGPFPSADYRTLEVQVTAAATGVYGLAYNLKWPGQPNKQVTAFIKNTAICKTTTARMGEEEVKEGFSAYPNPFQTTTAIRIPETTEMPINITIFDVSGRMVKELTGYTTNSTVEVGEGLGTGLYQVKAVYEGNVVNFTILKY